jgi:hypothetical protein
MRSDLLMITLALTACAADPAPPPAPPPATTTEAPAQPTIAWPRVDLEGVDLDLRDAIASVASRSGVDVVVAPEAQGTVSVWAADAPADGLLAALAHATGYVALQDGARVVVGSSGSAGTSIGGGPSEQTGADLRIFACGAPAGALASMLARAGDLDVVLATPLRAALDSPLAFESEGAARGALERLAVEARWEGGDDGGVTWLRAGPAVEASAVAPARAMLDVRGRVVVLHVQATVIGAGEGQALIEGRAVSIGDALDDPEEPGHRLPITLERVEDGAVWFEAGAPELVRVPLRR